MDVIIREYHEQDLCEMIEIWNEVVEEANAFPQMEKLTLPEAREFFASQSFSGVAVKGEEVLGLYILHPNNIGRCGHIANCSYAVKKGLRGQNIGEKLVRHSLSEGKKRGFKIMQFNAVVCTNHAAIHLYEKIGFQRLGTIPKGFLTGDGSYRDIILYYIEL
ncbi:MAG TPA: GNAT family N-acetyltransferase [Peptococcaceae bacterium]|nr:GNAT family N-acetyltransferase [Peptococcaceae bacterium]